ncbi:MAG: glutamine-hydrolyzing GMP synthase [Mycoplasmataceae bacterium]|nr:glutamine-hydrolyzing GMP synthase [Mycoplasmataceae bacterium]
MANKILVIDFGSQYNQLIVRRIREFGVYSELVSNQINIDQVKNDKDIKGIIFSGGPNSVYDKHALSIDRRIYKLGVPILGICYGMQLITYQNGGIVQPSHKKEYGSTQIIIKNHKLTKNLLTKELVWMSHGDQVKKIPANFKVIAASLTCKNAIIVNDIKKIYGIQFHPEVRHTVHGLKILQNFIFDICGAKADWTMQSFITNQIIKIKQIVKNEKVLCALSGGVDSAVTAAIIAKAINKNLTCLFVDHGLLRKNEGEAVTKAFKKYFNVNFIKVNASKQFLTKLKNISNPEQKRKIIGREFIETFDYYTKHIKGLKWLAQGTLYTDVIESGTSTAQTIKSHHNVGGLPKNMKFKLIEPLNTLFKDEVRELGRQLGLPEHIVNRQPFPGPGLAIRIIGSITSEKIRLVQETDVILQEEIKKAKLDQSIWQYFTVLPNVKTVGVKGDQRSYEDVIIIRAVTSQDGMTADYAKIPYHILDHISNRIVNEVKGINRVVYDITSKPPGTIEWE